MMLLPLSRFLFPLFSISSTFDCLPCFVLACDVDTDSSELLLLLLLDELDFLSVFSLICILCLMPLDGSESDDEDEDDSLLDIGSCFTLAC